MLPTLRIFPVSIWFLFLTNINLSFTAIEVTVTPISENEGSLKDPLLPIISDDENAITSGNDSISTNATNRPVEIHSNDHISTENSPQNVTENKSEAKDTKKVPVNVCNDNTQIFLFVPDESNCSNYYQVCTPTSALTSSKNVRQVLLNSASVYSCPIGTFFDSISAECVIRENAHCGAYNCPEPNGYFPDSNLTNRQTFIQCIDDVPKRQKCKRKRTVFDNVYKTCIWDEDDANLNILLRFLKAAAWFVKYTESPASDNPEKSFHSTEGYIKTGIVSILIPTTYWMAVVILYKLFNKSRVHQASSSDEFYNRYFRRPIRNRGFIDLHPLGRQPTRNNESYLVTSTF